MAELLHLCRRRGFGAFCVKRPAPLERARLHGQRCWYVPAHHSVLPLAAAVRVAQQILGLLRPVPGALCSPYACRLLRLARSLELRGFLRAVVWWHWLCLGTAVLIALLYGCALNLQRAADRAVT